MIVIVLGLEECWLPTVCATDFFVERECDVARPSSADMDCSILESALGEVSRRVHAVYLLDAETCCTDVPQTRFRPDMVACDEEHDVVRYGHRMEQKLPEDGIWRVRDNPIHPLLEVEEVDALGYLIYGIGILLFIYGFTSLMNTIGQVCVLVGFILLLVFGYYETKAQTPAFNMNLFRNMKFTSSNVAALCSYLAVAALTTILNYHFQYVRGWNAQMSGLILIVTPIIMAFMAPNSGKLSDRIHPQKLAAIGMSIATVALLILIFLDANTPIYLIVLAMVLQGIGMGLFTTPNTNAIMSSVPPKETPNASAAQSAMRTIGQTMSLGLLTLVFAWIMGSLKLSSEYAGMIVQSSQIVCIICTVICIIAIFASLVGIKSKDEFNIE